MDLAGLLNANALYSFATGLLQLMFGTFLVYEKGVSLERCLPMSVSCVSLILCLANVIFDFGAMVCELESEIELAQGIFRKWDVRKEEKLVNAQKKHDMKNAEIEAKFSGGDDNYARIDAKKVELKKAS